MQPFLKSHSFASSKAFHTDRQQGHMAYTRTHLMQLNSLSSSTNNKLWNSIAKSPQTSTSPL
jgi:hypothetical protein